MKPKLCLLAVLSILTACNSLHKDKNYLKVDTSVTLHTLKGGMGVQQMWMALDWNAIPGTHPLISTPKNLDDYVDGIATLLEYLTIEKEYSCIKYFGMTNEPPGDTWGYWWERGETDHTVDAAWKKLYEEFRDSWKRWNQSLKPITALRF